MPTLIIIRGKGLTGEVFVRNNQTDSTTPFTFTNPHSTADGLNVGCASPASDGGINLAQTFGRLNRDITDAELAYLKTGPTAPSAWVAW